MTAAELEAACRLANDCLAEPVRGADAQALARVVIHLAEDRARLALALDGIGDVIAHHGCECDDDLRPEELLDEVPDEHELCWAHQAERAWKRALLGQSVAEMERK